MHLLRSVCFCVAIITAAACTHRLPPHELPRDLPAQWTGRAGPGVSPATTRLLDLVDSEELRSLVAEALENNPDLAVTARRLSAAGYLLTGDRARRWPTLSAGFTRSRDNQ